MRKVYTAVSPVFFLSFLILILSTRTEAQTTVSSPSVSSFTYSSASADGAIVFGIKNTNTTPITITGISHYVQASFTATFGLWYHTTAVTGAPSAISLANGWLNPANVPVTTTTAGMNPTFSGLNITIPAGSTYRFAISGPPFSPYYGGAGTTPNLYSGGGLQIFVQDNASSPGYGGAFPGPPANTPRSFLGSVTFMPTNTCTDPPTPGTAIAPAIACIGSTFNLDLTGNSIGTGQTYQWQSSPDNTTWTNLGASTNSPLFPTTIANPTYFRAQVTCGATTLNSVSVLVDTSSSLSGVYTINALAPAAGRNFQSYTAAITKLTRCGISGPVTFNVVGGSGPYNEQITIPAISGASAVNTITFKGNLQTITASTTSSAARSIITLNGADYITLDSLVIEATGGTYGWGVLLTGAADFNKITNCVINTSTTNTTSVNYCPIAISGSLTSPTTSGNNGNNNQILNNTTTGGYYGIVIYGNSTADAQNLNNTVSGNKVSDTYSYSVYSAYQSGALISGNEMTRPTRTASTTTAGVFLTTGNINCRVEKNRIHHMFAAFPTSTSTMYGVYVAADGTAAAPNKVINNLIYSPGGNGVVYGIYNTAGPYMQAYHNTISIDDQAATSGAAYGLYQTTAAVGIDYKNNVVYVSRSGTGTKRCVYFVTTTSTITSNNNNLFMASTGGTNNHLGQFGTTNYTTFANWQTANGGIYDQQSINQDPQFTSPGTGDYTPGNVLTNNTGVNVGVTTDINGNPRSNSTPDAGAYEFSFIVAGINMSAEALVTPAVSTTGCYTAAETVTIRIRNNGTTTVDMAVNPVTVTVNVSGAATQALIATVNSGTLASNATMDVVMPGTVNMSAAGIYTFDAFTNVTGDVNPSDNAMQPVDRTKITVNPGIISVSPENFCVSQTNGPVLSTDGNETGYTSLQWQQSTTSGTGFVNIPGATTVPYTAALPTQTMYYRLVATCGAVSQPSSEVVVNFVNPQITGTTPGSRCGPGTVTLGATGSAGTILNWYEAPTGGTALNSGNSFVTPSLTNTTTYYVAANTGGGGFVTAGLANAISTTGYTLEAGLFFDAIAGFTLEGVYVYPMGTGAGTATIALQNSAGTTMQSVVANLTGTGAPYVKTFVPLNFTVPIGTNYRLVMLTRAGSVSGLIRESGSGWGAYPVTTAGVVTITNGKCCPDATSTSYYYFYDWKITAGCESPRTAVVATIGGAAALNSSQDTVACNNAITPLTIESNLADYNSYIWSPTTGLFTDAAATIPYAGASATTVYVKTATAGKHKFYVNASNSSTGCANIDSSTVTVLPSTLSIAATQSAICGSGTTTLSVAAGEYGTAIQWYTSTDGISYSVIPGATSIQYVTPVLTDTTYYKLEIKNGTGSICLNPTIRIDVGGPEILTTAPATRCGPGSITVGATGTAGSTVRWFADPTGGSPLATGNNYTTNVTANTTFYAEASEGGGSGAGSPVMITEMFIGDPDQLEIQNLSAVPVDVTGWKVAVSNNYTNITAVNADIHTLSGIMAPGQIMTWSDAGSGPTDWGSNILWNPGAFPTFSGWAAILDNNNNLVDVVFMNWPSANIQGASITVGTTTITVGSQWSGNGIDISSVPTTQSVSRQGTTDNNSGTDFVITTSSIGTTNPGLTLPFSGGGCSGVRVPVLASVITAPALNVAKDTLVCNNAIITLAVETNIADYTSYIWSPVAGLYTDAAATIPYSGGSATTLYAKITAAGAHKYYINSTNSSTSCANLDSVTVTVLPGTLNIDASTTALCQNGSVTLSIPAGNYGGLQWFTSPDGVTYSPIGGATSISYTTPVLSTTTHYKLEVKNGAGVICLQPTVTINVGTPQILGTTPAARCGPGTLTLGATVNPAAVANWYTAPTGGLPVFTGNSFVTPILNNTTTYYVASRINTAGAPATDAVGAGATTSATYSNPFYSLWSNTHNQHLIRASELAAAGISGGNITALALDITVAGTLPMIDLSVKMGTTSANDMTAYVAPTFTTVYTSASLMPAVGINTLTFTTPFYWDGVSNIVIEICHGNPASTATMSRTARVDNTSYVSTIHTHTTSGTAGAVQCANTTSNVTTYSVRPQFIFTHQSLCEGPRTAVTATVNPGPAFSVAKDSLICSGGITALSVETSLANFDSYTWTPTAGLYTDAAATVPYTGGNATTLYAKVITGGIHKYYINALNTSTNCTGIDSVKLTVLPASLTISATKEQICGSGSTVLSLPAGEYGTASIQWYTSPDGVAYTLIPGAVGLSYSTPVLTANTYYRVDIKNGAGTACIQPTIAILVGVPEIVATAPATRCDPGSVTIGATPGPAGATINWYANASGGTPIATGTTFNTPVLPVTTTYYAAAAFGFSTVSAGRPAVISPTNLAASPRGIQFNATQAVKLASVTVYSTEAAAGSGTIELRNSAGTVIAGPVNVSWGGGGSVANPIPNVLPLNFDVPIGTGHRLLLATRTGGGIAYETSGITGTWTNYTSPGGAIELTASMTSATGTSTTAYYHFYNWQIVSGCESARVPVNAIINGTITIDADPADRELCTTGQNIVFSVSATGAITNYQWRKNGINIPGATSSTYTIASASAGDVGSYDVIVSGPCSADTSGTADLTIIAPTIITTEPTAQSVCPGGTATFTTAATGGGSLGYQWRKNGVNIPGAYGTTFTITNATAGDAGNYDVVVTGSCNNDTSIVVPLAMGAATLVTTHPLAQTACTGNNITFTTVGSGSGTLTYQWRKGGVNIPGATSSNYTITGVVTGDAGIYDVVITGNCGSATSNVASLVVNAGTTISVHPLAQSTCIGTNVIFTVAASGSGTISYQWRKGGVNINGATSSSYTINGVTVADIGTYDVVISGSCGSQTSNPAALTISAPGTWIGVQNSNWNNAANWCGGIPTPATDVTIPNYAPNMPVLSAGSGSARNIVINAGATLTVSTDGILNLYGNLTATGTFTPTLGTIAFRGATAQTVPAFTTTNVIMNGSGGFTLAGQTTVTGALTLTNGHITLGANNLSLATGSTGSTTSHIITNGTGNVIVAALAAGSSRSIPVGINAASYTPVVLAANAGHTTDNMTVRVLEHVLANGTTGNQITSYVVDRTWIVNEVVAGGSNVNVTLQWNESDELQLFGRNECYVMHYTGGSWSTITETPASGANPYTQTRTNVTTFSPFAVQTDPLPNAVTGLFPNPTNSTLNIVVRTNQPEQLTMEIYDVSGKLMMTQRESVRFGGTLISIDVTRLITGTYILKVSTPKDREFFVRKFVKVN